MQSEAVVIRLDKVTQRYRVISERPDTIRELFARFLRHKTSFHDFDALSNISLSIRRGEVVGLIGRNGSGKSTTLKIIAGVYRPTSGDVEVKGTVAPLIELGAGFHPELTGRENIVVNGLLMGYSKSEMLSRQKSIIDFAGIGDFIDAPVKQYSSGMYTRLAFSVATEVNPDILVVDEILSVGDLAFQAKCKERLKNFRAAGKTILMVTHSMQDILSLCDRAIFLDKGQMIFEGDPEEAVALYRTSSLGQQPLALQRNEPATVHASAPALTARAGGSSREESRSVAGTVLLEERQSISDVPTEPDVEPDAPPFPPQPPPRNSIRNIHSSVQSLARRLSTPEFLEFDSWAIWFYVLCAAVFLIFSLADLNGSSMNIFHSILNRGPASPPVVGTARAIRMDEWSVHTPAILNQELRANKFEVQSTPLGTHSVALLGNIPVAHFSTIFRPQFWSFFVLPTGYAFAVYWQFKALLLLTGVFTWLLLLTRSTLWSITGALWFFFSPFMQWSYSWPSCLPEMVGLLCFVMVFACYLTVGRNPLSLALSASVAAACAINFGMCGYPPHLIPLAWLGIFFFAAWCVAKRKLIFRREQALLRIFCATAAVALVAIVAAVVYADVRTAVHAIAATVYPGKRVSYSLMVVQFYLLHFLNWQLTDLHVPPIMPNISEASGFLWLAPVTLFCLGKMAASRLQKLAFAALWCFSAVILGWVMFGFPVLLAKLMWLTRTGGSRPTPALGLANVAIVAICMASMVRRRDPVTSANPFPFIGRVLGIFAAIFLPLVLTNDSLNRFFSIGEVFFAAVFTTVLVMLMLEGRKVLLALALVVPSAFAFGGVNPLERGVNVFTSSDLYKFVHSRNDLLNSEWIVFSRTGDIHASEFVTGVGCEVYNSLRFVPDIDHFALFRAHGYDAELLNSDSHLLAVPIPPNTKPSLQSPGFALLNWNVSPTDPILKQLGIKYAAFAEQPSAAITAGLIPLSKGPVDHFWLYRLP